MWYYNILSLDVSLTFFRFMAFLNACKRCCFRVSSLSLFFSFEINARKTPTTSKQLKSLKAIYPKLKYNFHVFCLLRQGKMLMFVFIAWGADRVGSWKWKADLFLPRTRVSVPWNCCHWHKFAGPFMIKAFRFQEPTLGKKWRKE